MDLLRSAYDMLPRRQEQRVLSTKTVAVTLLCSACSPRTGNEVSELPYYGLSPPVYPCKLLLRRGFAAS